MLRVFFSGIFVELQGNVLYLKTDRSADADFNLVKAASNGTNTFVLSGSGNMRMYKVSIYMYI